MIAAASAVHRSTAATLAGASGALLVLTIVMGLILYANQGRKVRHHNVSGQGTGRSAQLEGRAVLVGTLLVATVLLVVFLTTMAIEHT